MTVPYKLFVAWGGFIADVITESSYHKVTALALMPVLDLENRCYEKPANAGTLCKGLRGKEVSRPLSIKATWGGNE